MRPAEKKWGACAPLVYPFGPGVLKTAFHVSGQLLRLRVVRLAATTSFMDALWKNSELFDYREIQHATRRGIL
jgi:hypothetical protein